MAVNEGNLPQVLPASVARVQGQSGLPTKALIDNEFLARQWYLTNVVALDTKLTDVASQTDQNAADIHTETTARTSADGALAQQITDLTANVGTNQAQVETQLQALSDSDQTIAAAVQSVTTTVDGHSAELQTLQSSVDGVSALYSVTGTINGISGGFSLSGVTKNDGSVSYGIEFTANTFTLTDPGYNGGAPQNVFSYGGGVFTFNVPVQVSGGQISPGAISQWGRGAWGGGETAVGAGTAGNADQHFAGCSVPFSYDGTPCCVDVVGDVVYRVIGASGFPVTLTVYVHLDGTIVDTIVYRPNQINDTGIVAVNKTYRLFFDNAGDLAVGNHEFYFSTSYSGSAAGSVAYLETGTALSFILLKKTGS